MFARRKGGGIAVMSYDDMIRLSRQLHADLVNNTIKGNDAVLAVFRLRHLYREIIRIDAHKFESNVLSEPYEDGQERMMMKQLLDDFWERTITKEEMNALQSLELAEADHMRAYFRFEEHVIEFAKRIHHHLYALKVEMSQKPKDGQEPSFYKYGEPAQGAKRVIKLLANVGPQLVPIETLKLFVKVHDEFAKIKPSSARPPKVAKFYDDHLQQLNNIEFTLPKPKLAVHHKAKHKRKVRRKKHHHAAPQEQSQAPRPH